MEIERIADENLIFLDETGFSEHYRRKYGYSLENTKAYISVPANRSVNKSLMCAISNNGVVGKQLIRGAYNSDLFINFIREQLIPYFRIHSNSILVMDNAKIHKSSIVIEYLRSENIAFKFIVPYSPELNPIEEFFSMLKSRFYTVRIEHPDLNIEEAIMNILRSNIDFSIQCQNFYRNMRRWLEKARRMEHFI
jgi:transposase